MMDCKKILTGLFEEIEYVKMRVPTAGTRFRLMALVADVEELLLAVGVSLITLPRPARVKMSTMPRTA